MLEEMPVQSLLCHSSASAQGLQQSQPAALHSCSSMRASASCAGKGVRNTQIPPGGLESLSTSSIGRLRRKISALNSVTALNIATFISDMGFVMAVRKNRGVMNHWDE